MEKVKNFLSKFRNEIEFCFYLILSLFMSHFYTSIFDSYGMSTLHRVLAILFIGFSISCITQAIFSYKRIFKK